MRIISGNLKGKKLLIPDDNLTRPLKDAVKESIFNILQHSKLLNCDLLNSSILDRFSGVGTFGLECISRKSKHVTFFENHLPAIKMLKKNIKNLNCSSKTKIIERDVFSLEKLNFNLKNFEFIFLDPPFKELSRYPASGEGNQPMPPCSSRAGQGTIKSSRPKRATFV